MMVFDNKGETGVDVKLNTKSQQKLAQEGTLKLKNKMIVKGVYSTDGSGRLTALKLVGEVK